MTLPCPWCDAPLRVTDATLARGTRCPACAVLVVVAPDPWTRSPGSTLAGATASRCTPRVASPSRSGDSPFVPPTPVTRPPAALRARAAHPVTRPPRPCRPAPFCCCPDPSSTGDAPAGGDLARGAARDARTALSCLAWTASGSATVLAADLVGSRRRRMIRRPASRRKANPRRRRRPRRRGCPRGRSPARRPWVAMLGSLRGGGAAPDLRRRPAPRATARDGVASARAPRAAARDGVTSARAHARRRSGRVRHVGPPEPLSPISNAP